MIRSILLILVLASCSTTSADQRACERAGHRWNDGLLQCEKLVVKTPDGYWPPD